MSCKVLTIEYAQDDSNQVYDSAGSATQSEPYNHTLEQAEMAPAIQLSDPDEDWIKIADLAERRRIQSRIAQRNYRSKLKRRLAELEKHPATQSDPPKPSETTARMVYESQPARDTENHIYYNQVTDSYAGCNMIVQCHGGHPEVQQLGGAVSLPSHGWGPAGSSDDKSKPESHFEEFYTIALYRYDGDEVGTLSVRPGDRVRILGVTPEGWIDGMIGSERGWIPSNYCTWPGQSGGEPTSFGSAVENLAEIVQTTNLEASPPPDEAHAEFDTFDPAELEYEMKMGKTGLPDRSRIDKSSMVFDKASDSLSSRRASLTAQKNYCEQPSDGELSFAGANGGSGNVTPSQESALSSRQLALGLASRLLQDYAQQQTQSTRSRAIDRNERSRESSSTSSPPSTARSQDTDLTLPSVSKRKIGKTGKIGGGDGDDDDDDESTNMPPKRLRSISENEVKLFACPFAKYDPGRYSERNTREPEYRSCSSCLLRDIARLKQHLYRVHRRPDHYCPSCFDAFKTQTLLEAHVRARSCEIKDALYAEKMTKDQMTLIKRRHRGETPVQNWFSIFKILFPDVTLPESPYAGEGDGDQAALQHFVNYFRTFGPEQFFNLMRDRQGSVQRLEASTQAIVDEAFEIAAPELVRQLQSRSIADTESPYLTEARQASALSASETISEALQEEIPSSSQPQHHSLDQSSADPWLPSLQMPDPTLTFSGLPDILDFDTTFDPLTIEDSFLVYGGWK